MGLVLCFDTFSNVCKGVLESFGKFLLEFFILPGISTGQLPIYGLLLFISIIFNLSSADVAKAQFDSLIGNVEGRLFVIQFPPSDIGAHKLLSIISVAIKGLRCGA